MIKPLQSGQALLDDIAASHDASSCRIWWLGQSGYLVQFAGRHLLLDPYLSDSLTDKYAATDKPHVRMTGRVIAPEQLDFIDVATSSHNHTDHLDAFTLLPLKTANPEMQLVMPEANRDFVANRLQVASDANWLHGLWDGATTTIAGFTFTGLPAAHNELSTDDAGRHQFMGYIVEFGPYTIYHSGDTLWYEGMEGRLKNWSINLAILPINGNKPERRVAGNLDGNEAARLAYAVGAKCVTPCHYEMFAFNTASPALFENRCSELGQPFRTLKAGECLSLSPTG